MSSVAVGTADGGAAVAVALGRSQLRVVLRRFWRDRVARISLLYIGFVFLAAIGAPLVALLNGHPPNDLSHQFGRLD